MLGWHCGQPRAFEPLIPNRKLLTLRVKGFIVLALLGIALIKADSLTTLAEDGLFPDNIVYAKSSPYQRIVVTCGKPVTRFF